MTDYKHCIAYLVGPSACNCRKCSTHEPSAGVSCIECESKDTKTMIEAESQGRGSPPLYRCHDCGAQWGRD